MKPNIFGPRTAAEISAAISHLTRHGHVAHASLMRAVLAGEVALAGVYDRAAPIRARHLCRTSLPLIVMVGDDDASPTGPNGWRCASELARWAGAAVVHGAAATVETYTEAIAAARATGRALLIETDSAHVSDWAELVRGKPTLNVIPGGGLVHPVPAGVAR